MKRNRLWVTLTAIALAATLCACVNKAEQSKRDIQKFMASVAGEYLSATGDTLIVAPVYARMIALDTIYVERTSVNGGTSGRLIELAQGKSGKILMLAYGF